VNETLPPIPVAPAATGRVKPASYKTSLLLLLAVLVLSQIAGEALLAMRRDPQGPGTGTLVLLGIGAAAVLGLVIVNARWLWATLGNLRYALALITLWGVSSVLGTLVVQRVPNQTDEGYAHTFTEATGDFFYNATHLGGGVEVHPEPDVLRWFDQQERLFGKTEGGEIRKEWISSATGRLKGQEIRDWTAAHDGLMRDVLAAVSWLRLPEAFQISVWFKTLLALLCLSLVIVVIQRWRGEWRQVGWAMAHLGMVVFCIGASVRATTKVDGFLVMHVGDTKAYFERKVDPSLAATDPRVRLDEGGKGTFLLTPLDFEVHLNRFKTEYPKHLFVSFPDEGVDKSWRMTDTWRHDFLGGTLDLDVARLTPDVSPRLVHGERPDGRGAPALRVTVSGGWLPQPEEDVLSDRGFPLRPPDSSWLVQYRRAADEAEHERLLSSLGGFGQMWAAPGDSAPHPLGEVRVGQSWPLGGGSDLVACVRAVWPDWAAHSSPDGAQGLPRDPAVELDLLRGNAPAGSVVVLADRMLPQEGEAPPHELRFEYDPFPFGGMVPVRYRLVDVPGQPPTLVTFHGDTVAETRELRAGDEVALGAGSDRLRFEQGYERHTSQWVTAPADATGRTAADMYYASLPEELLLEARGPALGAVVGRLGELFAAGQDPHGAGGIALPDDFARGVGQFTLTADRNGLLVRLVSDHRELSSFPDPQVAQVFASEGMAIPFRLDFMTNDRANPLRFTSDVSLLQGGKLIKRDLVEPNQPMYLAGFQFSQADFRREDPTYSGFGVVRDPSVSIVYFGMGILVCGVILLFYVNPMVARRRARKAA